MIALPGWLTAKLGPLPVWGWGAGLGAGGLVLAWQRSQSRAKATQAALSSMPYQDLSALPGGGGGNAAPVGDYLPYTGGVGYGFNPSYLCGNGQYVGDPSLCLNNPPGGGGTPTPTPTPTAALAQVQPATPFDYGNGGSGAKSYPVCMPGSTQTCTLELLHDPDSGIYFAPAASEWVGVEFATPMAPWQSAANQAIHGFMSSQHPATVPVGDQYGGIGYQSQAAAAAGGYWGQNGQWVSTPTPWNPSRDNPPLGTLTPGTPYTTGAGTSAGMVPTSGAIVGAPASYLPHDSVMTLTTGTVRS